MRRIANDDVFCVAVPAGVDITNVASLIPELEVLARDWVHRQWADRGRPIEVEFAATDWLITRQVEDIEKFQPAHHCAACLAGNDQARAFLKANPGRYIAMANLHYVEVWP